MFVPATDHGVNNDAKWQLQVALMNAASNRFTLVRAALFGYLSVSDAYGRIVAKTPTRDSAVVTLITRAPLGPGHSLYSQYGDWLVLLCVLLSFTIILRSLYISRW